MFELVDAVAVVDDAVTVRVVPERVVAVLVVELVEQETPRLIDGVVGVAVELRPRVVRPDDHQVGARMRGDVRGQVEQVVGRVEVRGRLLRDGLARPVLGDGRDALQDPARDVPRAGTAGHGERLRVGLSG